MASEIRDVAAEVADRLRRRGVLVRNDDTPEDLADLLSAVERFEAAVEARGGDLFVDDLNSSEPDDIHFALPRRTHPLLRFPHGLSHRAGARTPRHQRFINVPRRSSS
jgi:hypothetical protein